MDLKDEAFAASDSLDKFVQTMEFAGIDNSKIKESQKIMKEYADQTVYELGDVMNTTAQLAANGVEDFNGLTQAIGNVNAVSGGNAETFKSVATAMTQTIGTGKLTTENFNQISDAIPGASGKIQAALKEMGAYAGGDFRQAMADGEISAEELNTAFMKLGMTDVAKKAAGSTKTIEGAVGNLQAGVVNMINEIIGALGKGNITSFIDGITKGVDNLTKKIGPAIKGAANAIKPLHDGFKSLFGLFSNDGDKQTAGLDFIRKVFPAEQAQSVISTINTIKKTVGTIFDAFKNKDSSFIYKLGLSPEAITAIQIALDGVKTYFKAVIDNLKNMLTVAWEIAKGVISSLAPYIIPIIQKIGKALGDIGKSLTVFWEQNGKQIIEAIRNFFTFIQPVVKIVMTLMMGFIDNVIGLVKGLLNAIQGAIKIFTGIFTGDFSKMWEGVKQLFWGSIQAVWNWIQILFFKRILEGVKGLWTGFSGSIKGLWESTKTFFTEGISKTWDKLANWVINLLGKAGNLKTTFSNFIKNMWNSVKNFFSNGVGDTWNKVVGWVKNIFNKATELKNKVSDVIGNLWNGIKDKFRRGIDTVFNWFSELPKKMKDAIIGGKNAIVDAFKSIFNAALKAIGKPVNAIIHGASWVLEKLGADKLKEWKVPQYAKGTPNGGHPGGPMMVNDGRGAEAVITPNGQAFIPRGRNVVLNAPKGTHVLTAEETAYMTGNKAPRYRYAKGTGFFGNLWNNVKGFAGDVGNKLKDVVGDVWDFVTDPGALARKVLNGLGVLEGLVKYPLDVGKGILSKATEALTNKITELFSSGSLDTSMGMQGVYKYLADVAVAVMKKFPGFQVTSGYREGDPYSHGKHNAIDIALPGVVNGSPRYTEAANYAFEKFANKIGYVITNGKVRDRSGQSGTGVHDDWRTWPDGDHYDHVHLNGVRDPQGGLVSGGDSVGGSGVERWRPYVKRALKMNNLPTSSAYVDAWMRQIQTESGGNPLAIGGNDGLADGNATGLLQTKPGTFAANAFPGYGNIMSGFDNILAAINYAKKRYGSDMLGVIGRGHGYANGGIVNQHQIAEIAEGNKPEIIIPLDKAKRSRAMQLLAIAQDKLGVKPKSVNNSSDSSGTLETLVSLMIQQNNLLSKLLAKDTSVKLDGKAIADNTNGYLGNQLKRSLYTTG
ncbi:tape measure protein [Enterococcus faecium]|nr:tape measure protein [Enterococcus faecium]